MNDTAARYNNRFVADLLQTMRSAAEAARQRTIEQCQADADAYMVELRNQTSAQSETLRVDADADVAAIRDRARAEIERIQAETEKSVAQRGEQLEHDLQDYQGAVERQVELTHEQVASYQDEVAQFCDRLLAEGDPTAFATMAVQMPNPPFFDAEEAARVARELLNAIGVPSEPEPAEEPAGELAGAPEGEAQAEAAEALDAAEAGTGPADEENEPGFSMAPPLPGADAAEEAQPAAAEQAEEPATETTEAAEAGTGEEAAAEPAVAPEPVIEAELGEEDIDARLSGAHGAVRMSGGESTQVIVVGLVSVASIAGFKRQLSRLQGVKSVGVSSGANGEFIFTAAHSADISLGDLITNMPGFQARVVSQRDGVLSIAAHDPEAEA